MLADIYDIIENVSQLRSRNDKVDTLKTHLHGHLGGLLLRVLYFTYNPFMQFNIKKLPLTISHAKEEDIEAIFNALSALSKKRGVTNAEAHKLATLVGANEKAKKLVHRIINKDLRCGVGIKTIQSLVSLPSHAPMLCNLKFELILTRTGYEYDDTDFKKFLRYCGGYDKILFSRKLDGVRCWAHVLNDTVSYISRTGKPYDNFHIFDKELIRLAKHYGQNEIIFDGEVISKDESFQDQMTQVRRLNGVDSSIFRYHIFDIVDLKRTQKLRYFMLDDSDFKSTLVHILPHDDTLKSFEEFLADLATITNLGGEGLVLKNAEAPYEQKRSNYWLKAKCFYSEDLPVIGMETGLGKYADKCGALIVDYQGKRVKIGSGLTDQQRADFCYELPKVVEVKHRGVTKDGSLWLPTLYRIREDKDDIS